MNTKLWIKSLLLIGFILFTPFEISAKKEKKPFKWEWDGTKSGNKEVDSYLMQCDTLWNKIQSYQENINQYEYKNDTVLIAGKAYEMVWMEDVNSQLLSTANINWQLFNSVLAGTAIVLDGTLVGLQTVNATLALPNLGFAAISYAKYLKAGPKIIGMATKEIKEIVNMRKHQWGNWTDLKNDHVDIKTLDLSSIGLTENDIKKISNCVFFREVASDEYIQTEVISTEKSLEDLTKEDGGKLLAMAQQEIREATEEEQVEIDEEELKRLEEELQKMEQNS